MSASIQWLLLVFVAACSTVDLAQPQTPKGNATGGPVTSITIRMPRAEVKLGRPLPLQITWTNISDHDILFDRVPAEFNFFIEVRDSQGKLQPLKEGSQLLVEGGPLPPAGRVALILKASGKPQTPDSQLAKEYSRPLGELGPALKYKVDLQEHYDLSKPGEYTVEVWRYDLDGKSRVRSNKIILTMTE